MVQATSWHDHARPIIFDFGMHAGEDTEFYLATGAHVVAFEANADLIARNKIRFEQAIEEGRLEIIEGAIVEAGYPGETVTFYVDDSKSVWGTTKPDWVERNSRLGSHTVVEVTVPAVNLASVLARYDDALYAKIDIEGADRHVLADLAASRKPPRWVSIESDKVSLDEVVAEIEQLEAMGYDRFAAVQQATIPGQTLTAKTFSDRPFNHRYREHASGPFGPYLHQPFVTAAEVIDDYRSIFRRYARFGDTSWLMSNGLTRAPTKAFNKVSTRLLGRPLCGWYDTHATG